MHALEYIAAHGRFERFVRANWLRRKLGRQKGQCTWCGGGLPPRRIKWCGDECLNEYDRRYDPNTIRRVVFARDRGVCRHCGVNTVEAKALLRDFRFAVMDIGRRARHKWARRQPCRCGQCVMVRLFADRCHWEADHETPVAEGGGGCPAPDGYRTLCRHCHKAETRNLAGRLAARRSDRVGLFAGIADDLA
jgi:5-methylcytosine-specific restriction endonuclease McrA